MSGVGEIKPPITKDKNKKILRLDRKKAEVIKFNFAIIIMTIGNSKIKPNGKTKAMTKSIY